MRDETYEVTEERKGELFYVWKTLKQMTNEQFIVYMLNWSKSGPMMQSFIVEALRAYSHATTENGPPADNPTAIVSPLAWYNIGLELKTKIDEKYGQ